MQRGHLRNGLCGLCWMNSLTSRFMNGGFRGYNFRLSTISLADQVVLVDEGRVVETGTHAELMRSCRRYGEVLGQLEAVS